MAFTDHIADNLASFAPAGKALGPAAYQALAKYLEVFGHLDGLAGLDDLRQRIRDLQAMLGCETDGWIGPQTQFAMETRKRCGLRTIARLGGVVAQWERKYATTGKGVFFGFESYIDGSFSRETQIEETLKAFGLWESISALRFCYTKDLSKANIVIGASNRRRDEFGTVGQVLAWCEMMQTSDFIGRLRLMFDKAENWFADFYRGTGAHEIGHGIGIDHTTQAGQLMYAYSQDGIWNPQQGYDIEQARVRYGEAAAPQPTPAPPSSPDLVTIVCGRPVTINGKAV